MKWLLPSKSYAGHSLIDEILSIRGFTMSEKKEFLTGDLSTVASPDLLWNSKHAASSILEAIKSGKKIFIHGDYDVDGVCATAVLWDYLYHDLNADVLPYIPSRFDEGYGLSSTSLNAIVDQGGQLVITVDCGIKDLKIISQYKSQGIDFIVTDHHTLLTDESGVPVVSQDALAVVHPQYPGHEYPFPSICGTTVVWQLCRQLAIQSKKEWEEARYLDLVALATVCDVMPLRDENRAIVRKGLEVMRSTANIGLRALAEVSQLKLESINSTHLGYALGPRLNAAGRLDSALDALRLLTTSSAKQAESLATKLQQLNLQRQDMTARLIADAEAQLLEKDIPQIILIWGEEWSEGLLGIVAGRLAEKYYRPVLVGSINGALVKGSGRSPLDFHLAQALSQVAHLLTRYGGHAQAAGFTLPSESIPVFTDQMESLAAELITADKLERELQVDVLLDDIEIPAADVAALDLLEPYGFGNAKPVFAIQDAQITNLRRLGKERQHIKLSLQKRGGGQISAIYFSAPDQIQQLEVGQMIDVAGNLAVNSWNGVETVEMQLQSVLIPG